MTEEPSTRRSRRAVLGLVAGALAGVAGCTALGDGDGSPDQSPDGPTDSPTDPPTTSPTGTGPEESPVDPESVTLTGVSVQSSALGRHVTDGALSLRESDDWLVYVSLGGEKGHTPSRTDRTFQNAEGYPERGGLWLVTEADGEETTYEEASSRNYALVGDAGSAWTAFELPAGTSPDRARVEWPGQDRTLGELSTSALDRLGDEPPSFTLESFVAGEPGTTPGPTPHQSPTMRDGEYPSRMVDYELVVRNDGGAGTLRGFLDHDTPKEAYIADYSEGGVRLATEVPAGETGTIDGGYRIRYRQKQATVQVRAVVDGGEATSEVATEE